MKDWCDCLKDLRWSCGWAETVSFPLWLDISYIIHIDFSCILGFSSPSPSGPTLPAAGRLWIHIPPISPPPDSQDELASAARSVWFLLKPLADFIWKILLWIASNQKFRSWQDCLFFWWRLLDIMNFEFCVLYCVLCYITQLAFWATDFVYVVIWALGFHSSASKETFGLNFVKLYIFIKYDVGI